MLLLPIQCNLHPIHMKTNLKARRIPKVKEQVLSRSRSRTAPNAATATALVATILATTLYKTFLASIPYL